MTHRLALAVLLVCSLCALPARADHIINWKDPAGPTADQRLRASLLARESIGLLDHADLAGAETKLREALTIMPNKAVWHYNLACILTARGQKDAAMESLKRATDCGFTDFTVLETSTDLRPLRDLPQFKELIGRKDEIRHQAAQQSLAQLQQQFGKQYIYEVDEEQKLIYAAFTDQPTLDAVKKWLVGQMKSQEADLFSHKPDEFIRVVVPSLADFRRLVYERGVMGIYEDETRTLLVQRMGQVMTHEFTHALHAADQRAVGQEHPVWLREGLAAMYEAAEFDSNGKFIPHDNYRLAYVQSAARRNSLMPLDKLIKLSVVEFETSPNLSYGQASSLLLYLYEQNLLRKFYDAFKASFKNDSTGEAALEETTGKTLADLQKAWTAWMLDRKAPQLTSTPGGAYLGAHFGQTVDGLKLAVVIPDGAAAKAGMKTGDIIIGIDDHEVRDYPSLAAVLAAHKPGDEVTLKVRRDGKYIDVAVVLGQR